MAIANTPTYITTYEDSLQARLAHPTTWKEMCDVTYSNSRTISSSYISTMPGVTTVTRGTGLVMTLMSETADSLTISTGRDLGLFVDWADLAQSPWTKPAELFDRIGQLLNEFIEQDVLARHVSWTNFGDTGGGVLGLSATPITVTASNIDDIIRGVKTQIRVANGASQMNSNGVGFVWRPADFELLEAFTQANGTMTADKFLVEGTMPGLHYLGADHYWSNDYAAGHVMGGVKKIERLGILTGTYGRAHTIEFPAAINSDSTGGFLSGEAFYSRVDIGHMTPSGLSSIIFDVNVA